MLTQLLQYNDIGLFFLRAAVAIIFLTHALPKLSKAKEMATMIGMPAGMIFMLGLVEVMASLGLALGFYTQLSALMLVLVMAGAISMKSMKWGVSFAANDKTGWEFDFVLLFACLAILLGGGGAIGL